MEGCFMDRRTMNTRPASPLLFQNARAVWSTRKAFVHLCLRSFQRPWFGSPHSRTSSEEVFA